MPSTRPCGAWPSPLAAAAVAAASVRLSQPRLAEGRAWWLEGRPGEGGRQTLVRARPDGAVEEMTPAPADLRSRVHEYGGGEYALAAGSVFHCDATRPGIHRLGGSSLPDTLRAARYADFAVSPDGRWLVAVEEEARREREPANRLVAFDLRQGGRRVLEGAADFVSSPVFSPDGMRLAWLRWDHPRMPWQGTVLRLLGWGAEGPTGEPRDRVGGAEESIFQPGFSPDGRLCWVSDRSGWWNLVVEEGDGERRPCPRAAEFGTPQWVLGMRRYGFAAPGQAICLVHEGGRDRLARLDLASGALDFFALPHVSLDAVAVEAGRALVLGATATAPPELVWIDLDDGAWRSLGPRQAPLLEAERVSVAEAIEFPTAGGLTARAFYYPPRSPDATAPARERPPLVVRCHGGPTAAVSPALQLAIQFWTTRGFAVVDVDYGGSAGWGRAYRERLHRAWGVVDVEDCCRAAGFLADQGRVDGARLAIRGGSAGGYTVLCALAFRDRFAAGASLYGIGDLALLAEGTHKFEKHYTDWLVGEWPAERQRYRERSPAHFADRIEAPVIFFQGLQDRVVPPDQAETMVAALAERGVPHAYVAFEGEAHGFRRAENIQRTLEGELFFYARAFGIPTGPAPSGLEIRG